MCSFLYLHKETNQQRSGEESAACSFGSTASNCPVLLKITGRLRNSLRSNSPRAVPVIFPLLGYVKWQKQKRQTVCQSSAVSYADKDNEHDRLVG